MRYFVLIVYAPLVAALLLTFILHLMVSFVAWDFAIHDYEGMRFLFTGVYVMVQLINVGCFASGAHDKYIKTGKFE